jgi:CRP/FNR family transcriptional regulator, cyclic AMP receptor protein
MSFSSFFNYPLQDSDDEHSDYIFLPDWSNEEWGKLLKHSQTQLFEQGKIVIKAGEAERSLYILAFGTLEVLMEQRGKNRRIASIQSGSVVGEQSFLDGRPRSASIRAASECQILQLSRDSFDIFAAREPSLARAFLFDLGRILSLRLRSTLEQLTERT